MLSRGLPVKAEHRNRYYFLPPAGTHLVIHMMNRIKARYRFVDLLKPEDDAVLPLLLALEPDYFPELDLLVRAVPLLGAYLAHGLAEEALPRRPGDLADVPEGGAQDGLHGVLGRTLGYWGAALFLKGQEATALQGNLAHEADGEPGMLARALGWLQAWTFTKPRAGSLAQLSDIWLAVDDDERLRKLHLALWTLGRKNTAFQIDEEAPNYLRAAAATASAGGFQVVAYGHTHLPKHKKHDTWTYLNSGTWADVIRVPVMTGDFAKDRAVISEFVADMRTNQLAGYRRRYLSFLEVELDAQGGVTEAALRSYGGPGHERCAPLTAYPSEG